MPTLQALFLLTPPATLLLTHDEQVEQATEFLALALSHRESPLAIMDAWSLISRLRDELLNELDAGSIQATWTKGETRSLASALSHLKARFPSE